MSMQASGALVASVSTSTSKYGHDVILSHHHTTCVLGRWLPGDHI